MFPCIVTGQKIISISEIQHDRSKILGAGKQMSNIKLSDQHVEELIDLCCGEEDEEAFILSVDRFVKLVRSASTHKLPNRAPTKKRIETVKKAFAKLSEDDKDFLDRQIDGCFYFDNDDKKIPSCKNMMLALDHPLPSNKWSRSRKSLVMFAFKAIHYGWVDVSNDNTVLTAVLKIIIKEAGVTHDAVDIAGDAASLHNRCNGDALKNL